MPRVPFFAIRVTSRNGTRYLLDQDSYRPVFQFWKTAARAFAFCCLETTLTMVWNEGQRAGPDCRMYAILLKERRTTPKDLVATAERIELFGILISYAGIYTVDGDKIGHIDAWWNQSWTGTTQVRHFRVEGKLLYIKTLPARKLNNREENFIHVGMAEGRVGRPAQPLRCAA